MLNCLGCNKYATLLLRSHISFALKIVFMKNEIRYKTITSEGMGQTAQNLDEFLASGYYLLELTHGAGKLGLPIEDCANRHYMVAHLLVSDSGTAATLQKERRVGQTLVLTNSNNGATRVYTRTALLSKDGAAWSSWTDLGAAVTSDIQDGAITVEKLSTAVREKVDNPLRPLFIAAGAEYNDSGVDKTKTAPWGEQVTHKAGHYYLNGLGDITEAQMMEIYNYTYPFYSTGFLSKAFRCQKETDVCTRTNLRSRNFFAGQNTLDGFLQIESVCYRNNAMEVLVLSHESRALEVKGLYNVLYDTYNLKHLIGTLYSNENTSINFYNCKELLSFNISNLKNNILLAESSKISKATILFTIQNATPISAITITLHPNAYARLANDADIVAALQAQPLVTLVSA